MSYEKDKLDSYVTSNSLSAAFDTRLAPYVTSNSLSAAIAGIDLTPYVTSNSLSAAVATNALTVRGAASVSATLSAGAVTVAGRPIGNVLLGYDAGNNKTLFAFSGSWSDFCILRLDLHFAVGTGSMPLSVFTDGGGTACLTLAAASVLGAGVTGAATFRVYGGDNQARKMIDVSMWYPETSEARGVTSTATTGYVNCLRISLTNTASFAFAALYGYRKT